MARQPDQHDRELARTALEKRGRGDTPTQAESAALRRVQAAREEELRWRHYESIPQKHWRQMSGRQTKVLQEQAERYGIPFAGREIDLPTVVRKLHDFLAANKHKLARDDDDDILTGESTPALERLRLAKAQLAEIDLAQRQRDLIPRAAVHEQLGRIAAILRNAGDTLQSQFGPDALDVLNEAIDDIAREIDDHNDSPANDPHSPQG